MVHVNVDPVASAVHESHVYPSHPIQSNVPGTVVDGVHVGHPNAGAPAVPVAAHVVQSNDPGVVVDAVQSTHVCPGVAPA